jgi:hypothetical protein
MLVSRLALASCQEAISDTASRSIDAMKVKRMLVTRDPSHHHQEYLVALAEDGTLWWTPDLGLTWTSMKEPGPEHNHGPNALCTTLCPVFEREVK